MKWEPKPILLLKHLVVVQPVVGGWLAQTMREGLRYPTSARRLTWWRSVDAVLENDGQCAREATIPCTCCWSVHTVVGVSEKYLTTFDWYCPECVPNLKALFSV